MYERGAQGWSLNATIPLDQLDHVFRLDEGAIYVRRNSPVWPPPSCLPPFRQYRKVNGSWTVVATIGGERCDDHVADVNDGRALVVREPIGDPTSGYRLRSLRTPVRRAGHWWRALPRPLPTPAT